MTEHIGNNETHDRHVVLQWNGEWYKLPFYLLEDIVGEVPGLDKWIRENMFTWKSTSVGELKQLLKNEMPSMVAYKIYEPFL